MRDEYGVGVQLYFNFLCAAGVFFMTMASMTTYTIGIKKYWIHFSIKNDKLIIPGCFLH